MRAYFEQLWLLALCFSCLLGCGPIQGDHTQLVAYDRSGDSFRVLHVFSNVRVVTSEEKEKATHYAYLANLWRNREDLLLFPTFTGATDRFSSAVLYVDRHHGRHISLSSMGERGPLANMPNLGRILVTPGKFFSTSHGALSYSHEIKLQGRDFDALLRNEVEGLNKLIVDMSKSELVRRKQGGAVITWGEFRKSWQRSLSKEPRESVEGAGQGGTVRPEHMIPFNELTLTHWAKRDSRTLFSVSRTESTVRVSVAGAYRDILEFSRFVALFQGTMSPERVRQYTTQQFEKERAAEGAVDLVTRGVSPKELLTLQIRGVEKQADAVRPILSSLKDEEVTVAGMSRLSVTIDLLKILNCAPPNGAHSRYSAIVASDDSISASQLTAVHLRKAGVLVSVTETLEKVLKRFSAE
jgi:hypothetical protein